MGATESGGLLGSRADPTPASRRAGAQLRRGGDDAHGLHSIVSSVGRGAKGVNGCDVLSQFRGEWLLFNYFLLRGIPRS